MLNIKYYHLEIKLYKLRVLPQDHLSCHLTRFSNCKWVEVGLEGLTLSFLGFKPGPGPRPALGPSHARSGPSPRPMEGAILQCVFM